MDNRSLLQNIYLFKEFNDAQLEKVGDLCEMYKVEQGKNIFVEKGDATALFIIKVGSVHIHQKGETGENIEVATLGKGSHIGEMAFLDEAKRSATATAREDSEIVKISFDKLQNLLDENPDLALALYKSFSHFLCSRLRLTTSDLSYAREKTFGEI